MTEFVLVDEYENSGPYRWTNINCQDYFSFNGAWGESFMTKREAIHRAKIRTEEGWIVSCFKDVGYTVNQEPNND